MHRLLPIEGLRAYLALWVVVAHVMFLAGVDPHGVRDNHFWTALGQFFGDGPYAVQIFMIVSGFVIFYLLDHKKESYRPFLVRRFFRLYPVYVLLLFTAILSGPFHWWIIQHSAPYMTAGTLSYCTDLFTTTWSHEGWNIFLHLIMFQGIFPDAVLGMMSPYSFIIAAWSIAIEWQFYLMAPLIYFFISARSALSRILLCAFFLLLYVSCAIGWWSHYVIFFGNFVPFFFLGIASYFLHKTLHGKTAPDTAFLITLGLALAIYFQGIRMGSLIPIVLWLPFLGLLCEPSGSISSRWLLGIFNNRIAQYLGAISYGIYLSHEQVMFLMQYFLVTWAPPHSQHTHLLALLASTILFTILLSALLHHFVELPGMALGKKLAARLR